MYLFKTVSYNLLAPRVRFVSTCTCSPVGGGNLLAPRVRFVSTCTCSPVGVLGIDIAHQKTGVVGAGTGQKGWSWAQSQKRGVLGAGTIRKKGILGASTTQKREKLELVAQSCPKGDLGSLFMYYLYFYLSTEAERGGS